MLLHPLHLIQLLPTNTLPHKFFMLIANNKTNIRVCLVGVKSERMKNRGENTKENNLWGCLVMGKNRRGFGGTYAFSSCAIKK